MAAAVLGMVACGVGCEGGPPVEQPALIAAAEREALVDVRLHEARLELDRPFVVFATPTLLIEEPGARRAPPVTVGSRPGPDTMASDDPDVVSVEPDGALLAHREGTTVVRSSDSRSILTIVVRARGRVADSRRVAEDARKAVSP